MGKYVGKKNWLVLIKLGGQAYWKSGEETTRAKGAFAKAKFWLSSGIAYSI